MGQDMNKKLAITVGIAAFLTIHAPSGAEEIGPWKIVAITDRLDGTKKFYAETASSAPVLQFGRSVSAYLSISCINLEGYPRRLGALIYFSEPVGLGETRLRYRIDSDPVNAIKDDFGNGGRTFNLFTWFEHDELMERLSSAKTMKAEIDLPWAGDVILKFDVSSAELAFGRIPCN
jgi:hypothetical protein